MRKAALAALGIVPSGEPAPEPEWQMGVQYEFYDYPIPITQRMNEEMTVATHRRALGPWEPVPVDDGDQVGD